MTIVYTRDDEVKQLSMVLNEVTKEATPEQIKDIVTAVMTLIDGELLKIVVTDVNSVPIEE